MRLIILALSTLIMSPAIASAQGTWEQREIARMAWPELQTFQNDREYREWLRDVDRMQRRFRNRRLAEGIPPEIVVAAVRTAQDTCNPLLEECLDDDSEGIVVVTGSRVTSSPTPSITNNQSAGVDEGDIVKRIGDFLLVLQDGRIFASNFRTMALTDRIDVYRRDDDGEPIGGDWYDEMLVQGDHILITAYSYTDEASEISVFRLDQETGKIERRGVFLISSEDYYDVDNYATRVVGDQLVIYTPYEPRDLADRRGRPVVRRWVRDEDFDSRGGGSPILSVRNIYRPVFGVYEPMVHTISVCDLGALERDDLGCESTAFIAGQEAEMYVAPNHIYLATTAADYRDTSRWRVCSAIRQGWRRPDAAPGAVFRLPIGRGSPDLLPIRGLPFDQFSMDESGGRFRSLLHWPQSNCSEGTDYGQVAAPDLELTDEPLGAFRDEYREVSASRMTELPSTGVSFYENRFIGDWLIYGSRSRNGHPPDPDDFEDQPYSPGQAIAVRTDDAQNPVRLELGHEISRLEALGTDAIATGYRDVSGLIVSYLDLGETAQIADRAFLKGHFESESRSHAFNAMTYDGGDGLMGLPTVRAAEDAGRYPWESDDSGISFLRFDPAGQMTGLGWIAPDESAEDTAPGYSCEVSCIDWYGNARPIFIDRSVFALMGTELVEGRIAGDAISVARRLDLTDEPSP